MHCVPVAKSRNTIRLGCSLPNQGEIVPLFLSTPDGRPKSLPDSSCPRV